MTRTDDQDRCASKGCTRILTGKSMIVARDGRRFCKHHGDRLPKFLRRIATSTEGHSMTVVNDVVTDTKPNPAA